MIENARQLTERSNKLKDNKNSNNKIIINVSMGTCGIAAGTSDVLNEIKKKIKARNLVDRFCIVETGCMGICHSEPSIEIISKKGNSYFYGNVIPERVEDLLDSAINDKVNKKIGFIEKTWCYPETEGYDKKFLQTKIVLKNSGRINPENIDDYIIESGYQALGKVLKDLSSEDVVSEIEKSGLRGRGGGGFPTGKKWSIGRNQDSNEKYIICNADEGDPGAFMDRAVLEGDPHAVIEAMTIAGYAIGANHGVIYIRAEYPLAIKRLKIAIKKAREYGLLGENILSSGFNFDLSITYGAGAFVCGEETALINSTQGQRGMPTFRPPFPAVRGLWEKPTIVNNVETFANIPVIIRKGADWFRKVGTKNSPGTKVFALAGKIDKVGLIEVPMGITLSDVIYKIGSGIRGGKKFKAVQTGGPSGGCISEENINISIDYDSLKTIGSMMGSGGMVVMDEENCMVDIAKFFLDFSLDESCGKCTPCRVGVRQLYEILNRITIGKGKETDIQLLNDLSYSVKTASLCGLGQTCPNPVLTSLRYFEDEFKEHILDKKCKSKSCKELITYTVSEEKCVGCTLCAKKCPTSCISGIAKKLHEIDQSRCIRCGECYNVCRFDAITRV
jgi:NADH:ubiquinone oxidoreductase subunit F (NADH-binding)/(2Fe-2S) ferredoxin